MLELSTSHLHISLHEPEDGFYRGTRFDRAGVFDSILFDGTEMAGRWFDHYDPFMHDAVCGPAEEFSPVFTGRGALKIGVGLLDVPDASSYDRFKLYKVLDGGRWECFKDQESVTFRHEMNGLYRYEKVIAVTGDTGFEIRHTLQSDAVLKGEVYNHNFFTFGRMEVGPWRKMDFPFTPAGTWRSEYDSVGFTPSGIRFFRPIVKGESLYTGNIHTALSDGGMPYEMSLADDAVRVHIAGDVPCTHTVMWANYRVACLEPYNDFVSAPGKDFSWTVRYRFSKSL